MSNRVDGPTVRNRMTPERSLAPAPALTMAAKPKGVSAAEKIFLSMRAKIAEVFPDDDEAAWSWTDDAFRKQSIERPETEFRTWLEEQYKDSDAFTQRLVRRMFTIWDGMERDGFVANDKELYEHQKALFAWIAISTATGVREELASILVRSPYGSGKSLVSGLVVRAFKEAQDELIAEGKATEEIPTGILLGLRKEHMLQNALGKQFAVLQPPYTVERQDIAAYWRSLGTMFGPDFSESFAKPAGKKHAFYDLFVTSEDEEAAADSSARLEAYLAALKEPQRKNWAAVPEARKSEIMAALLALMDGKAILIPDIYKVPRMEEPLPREEDDVTAGGYRGDSAHALVERAGYRVKASHKHLAVDRANYTTVPDPENPAHFAIVYGTMVTRATEDIRRDVREEIMTRVGGIFVDEAGAYTPESLGDSSAELTGRMPYILGFTGQDRGTEGWMLRSPTISTQKMVELGLMKPIAFQGIGDARNPTAQGTEEAWAVYERQMFSDVKTATALKLPQPHEMDRVVVAPSACVREYAHRIQRQYEKRGTPVKVWCYDSTAGESRWPTIVNGFNAPKKEDSPIRVLVAPPGMMAEALTLSAQCYDILAKVNTHALDQTRGRLGHVRNDERGAARERTRTYFRVQWFEGGSGEPYIREVAKMMGFALEDEHETWRPLRNMIDLAAYEADGRRRGLSEPEPIPDAAAIAKRKNRRKEKRAWTPLQATSPFVIEVERAKAERKRLKEDAAARARAATPPGVTKPSAPAPSPHPASIPMIPSAAPAQPAPRASLFRSDTGALQDGDYEAKAGKTVLRIAVRGGTVENLADIASAYSLQSYMGALSMTVRDAVFEKKTGEELAKALLTKILKLVETSGARANAKRADHADSSNRIEMRFGGR